MSASTEHEDWLAMDQRLTKIEEALVTIQTMVNLMHDLLANMLGDSAPIEDGEKRGERNA